MNTRTLERIFSPWLVDEVSPHVHLRFFHGMIYRRYDRDTTVTMLIPFNLIARFLLSVCYIMKAPAELWWERKKGIKFMSEREYILVKALKKELKRQGVNRDLEKALKAVGIE